jgi:hypothetical protein
MREAFLKLAEKALDVVEKIVRVVGAPNIGQLTSEGVYIGRFKDKDGVKKDYFANTQDELRMAFRQASDNARRSNALGHNDWEVPTPKILSAMFNNRIGDSLIYKGGERVSARKKEAFSVRYVRGIAV